MKADGTLRAMGERRCERLYALYGCSVPTPRARGGRQGIGAGGETIHIRVVFKEETNEAKEARQRFCFIAQKAAEQFEPWVFQPTRPTNQTTPTVGYPRPLSTLRLPYPTLNFCQTINKTSNAEERQRSTSI